MTRHGSLGLIDSRCTSCMLCVRECPVWCISLSAHSEPDPESPPGPRQRRVNILDDFSIDYGLCMFCGICVDVCPFDALEWRAADDLIARTRDDAIHDRPRLA